MVRNLPRLVLPFSWLWLILLICSAKESYGQSFSSGSNGSDGALNLTTPGTITFDPKSFSPPLDPDGDNVYNFTTINIGPGVTVKLSSTFLTGPVYWLATGNVTIAGTIDLNGGAGQNPTTVNNSSLRIPAIAGAGGYSGGVGGAPSFASREGNGPGGGLAVVSGGGKGGTFVASQYLIPLIGGSGGSGGVSSTTLNFGGGGGGGGGAILIASSTSINFTFPGTIQANGGAGGGLPQLCSGTCGGGGGGSGGAIRLIAQTVTVSGGYSPFGTQLFAGGGGVNGGTGTPGTFGLIRVESFHNEITVSNIAAAHIESPPFSPVVPEAPPGALKVTSLITSTGTIMINANPFSFPDATFNSSTPVTVNVQANFIPPGTVPKITVMSETGADQSISCSPLVGALSQSTCSAQITFPTGGSRGFVKATWAP